MKMQNCFHPNFKKKMKMLLPKNKNKKIKMQLLFQAKDKYIMFPKNVPECSSFFSSQHVLGIYFHLQEGGRDGGRNDRRPPFLQSFCCTTLAFIDSWGAFIPCFILLTLKGKKQRVFLLPTIQYTYILFITQNSASKCPKMKWVFFTSQKAHLSPEQKPLLKYLVFLLLFIV